MKHLKVFQWTVSKIEEKKGGWGFNRFRCELIEMMRLQLFTLLIKRTRGQEQLTFIYYDMKKYHLKNHR